MNKRRPLWDDSLADRSQYRLTYAEQLQRKASYVSKNKESAREELQKRQDLLKQGKIPEEIKKTLRNTSARPKASSSSSASNLHQSSLQNSHKSSVSQTKDQKDSKGVNLSNQTAKNETHFAPLKKTQKPSIEDHLDTLTKLDQAMKELEAAMLKAASPECKKPEDAKVLDESISEGSLFGISDDEEYLQSKMSEKAKVENNEDLRARYREILQDVNKEYSNQSRGLSEDFIPCSKSFQDPKPKEKNPVENSFPGSSFEFRRNFLTEEPIAFENVWADEDAAKILNLVEETRKDLHQMKISTNDDFEVSVPCPQPFQYDSDVIPQKFNLIPLEKPNIPRAGTSSLSIFNHVRNVQLDCRKFIIN